MIPTSFKPRRPRARAGALWIALGLFLVVLSVLMWRTTFSGFFWQVLEPVLTTRTKIGGVFGQVRAQFMNKNDLYTQNIHLQETLASTSMALLDRDLLYRENLELKQRLGHTIEQKRVLAGVIARPPALPYDQLIIDAGTREGVTVGSPVAAGGTVVIGTVSEVYGSSSRVKLFSSSGETYDALLQLKGGLIPISVEGLGAGTLVTKLPIDTAVAVGDTAVLPGLAASFIATVSAINAPHDQSFMTVYMRMPVSPFTLRYVEVWVGQSNDI